MDEATSRETTASLRLGVPYSPIVVRISAGVLLAAPGLFRYDEHRDRFRRDRDAE
ncbi:hypothetical protein [Actinoallomurus acaciae]|uniref:Uncharacterized protein n=1 Tax=Actinoallomurus acaciae TaxID=502577 RepID=A0ABV5YIH8_9ACTN